jgi:hypothetical protein
VSWLSQPHPVGAGGYALAQSPMNDSRRLD